MSNPLDRLLGDVAADRFHLEALASLASINPVAPAVESLAVAVVALVQDRAARIELAGVERLNK